MNILILTARFGLGHYSVSKALAERIEKNYPASNVDVCDVFEYLTHEHCGEFYSAYTFLVSKCDKICSLVYKSADLGKKKNKLFFKTYFLQKINRLIGAKQPDVIISTLPLCSRLISEYKEKYKSDIPLITCITDVSSHNEWINPHTDFYLVASESVRLELISKGVSDDSIFVNGIPVKEQFEKISYNKSHEKRLLIMGGGLGLIPMSDEFYCQINKLNIKTTIITGSNVELFDKLSGKYENINVIGYTNEVWKYMQNADLIITKPGGVTLFETIFSFLPILSFKPFLQQEVKNAAFIENMKIGKILSKHPQNCIEEINNLINNTQELGEMRNNIKKIRGSIDENSVLKILFSIEAEGVSA